MKGILYKGIMPYPGLVAWAERGRGVSISIPGSCGRAREKRGKERNREREEERKGEGGREHRWREPDGSCAFQQRAGPWDQRNRHVHLPPPVPYQDRKQEVKGERRGHPSQPPGSQRKQNGEGPGVNGTGDQC